MSAEYKKPPFRPFEDVLITSPSAGASVSVPLDGSVSVSGNYNNAQCNAVFVKIYPSSVAVSTIPTSPPPNDNSVIRFDRVGAATSFQGRVPAAVAAMSGVTTGPSNNRLVAWPRLVDAQGNITFGSADRPQFFAFLQAASGDVTVAATCCIWFTWTTEDTLNTSPVTSFGELGDAYRPVGLIVPTGAAQLVLSAVTDPPGSKWAHLHFTSPTDPGASGPEGIGTSLTLEVPTQYLNSKLLSTNISEPAPFPLNRLIGLWGTDHTVSASLIDVGPSKTFAAAAIPAGANRLFLAFHDGREWSNNQGQVKVTVTWS